MERSNNILLGKLRIWVYQEINDNPFVQMDELENKFTSHCPGFKYDKRLNEIFKSVCATELTKHKMHNMNNMSTMSDID